MQHHKPDNNGHSLDQRYTALQQSSLQNAIKYIAHFDPKNAIEADIVLEYVAAIAPDQLAQFPELMGLDAIFKSGAKYPLVKLKDYLLFNTQKVKPKNQANINYKVLGVSNETGVFINETLKPEETNQSYFLVEKNQFCYNPYRINVGSIGLNRFDFDNQIISGAYVIFGTDETQLLPDFLLALFKTEHFLVYVNSKTNGGVRMNFTFEQLQEWEISLPPIGVQRQIVTQIERQQAIIEGAGKILQNIEFDLNDLENLPLEPIGNAVIATKNGWSPRCEGGSTKVLSLRCLNNGRIDIKEFKLTDEYRNDIEKFYIREGDFFYSRGNTKELVALSAIVYDAPEKIVFSDLLTRVQFNNLLLLPEFAVILFNSKYGRDYFGSVPEGSSPTMVKVSQDYMQNFMVPLLGNIEDQEKIIMMDKKYLSRVTEISSIKFESEAKINQIINSIWESS
ncbi:MAG: restriction endonuclease subunit S [Methylococcales bacterium]|nr:restriction endonuclease subunit S [Methylococcales bacterium]